MKVDYATAGKPAGTLELFKVPDPAGGKPTYYMLTEHIRHHAKVALTLAEQVEQDVGSIANQ